MASLGLDSRNQSNDNKAKAILLRGLAPSRENIQFKFIFEVAMGIVVIADKTVQGGGVTC